MKYKLNKYAESFNQLLNSALELKPKLDYSFKEGSIFGAKMFYNLDLIPTGMKYDGGQIVDILQTEFDIKYSRHSNGNIDYVLQISFPRDNTNKISKRSSEICHNIINVTKENSANIAYVTARESNNSGYSTIGTSWGDNYCNSERQCLKNLNISQVEQMCYNCTSDYDCVMVIYLAFPQ